MAHGDSQTDTPKVYSTTGCPGSNRELENFNGIDVEGDDLPLVSLKSRLRVESDTYYNIRSEEFSQHNFLPP